MWWRSAQLLNMPIAITPQYLPNLGAHVRDVYRLHFSHELAAGTLKPLVIPYDLIGTVVLPVLYFSVPHIGRPWLYRARYLLWLFILAFNLHGVVTSSSANSAMGYAVGLMHAWGILWGATLLIWMKPQFEAERVERRKRTTTATMNDSQELVADGQDGMASGLAVLDGNAKERQKGKERGNFTLAQSNGHAHAPSEADQNQAKSAEAPDEDMARSLAQGYEYYWQAYPSDAPFLTRLDWSFDLVTSFRGTGWNWTVPVIPHFSRAEKPLHNCPVDIHSIPLRTRQGYRRHTTRRSFLRTRLLALALGYLALDAGSVLMMKDPHFILGPEFVATTTTTTTTTTTMMMTGSPANNLLPLPPFLAALPPWLLYTYRSLLGFSAIITAIGLAMSTWQLAVLFTPLRHLPLVGRTRAELWNHPSVYGAFAPNVLDKGLAGFWGGWWHQTFRVAFSAPSAWLARRGVLDLRSPRGKALAGLVAFAQSAFLHALGSVTCLPPSRPLAPPVFFLLSWVGVLVQMGLCAAAAGLWRSRSNSGGGKSGNSNSSSSSSSSGSSSMARVVTRAGNLAFVFVWLNATQYWFCDDLARAGIWLLEPVPVSPLRGLGLGRPGDSWWRWDRAMWPRWYVGRHWWESGIAL